MRESPIRQTDAGSASGHYVARLLAEVTSYMTLLAGGYLQEEDSVFETDLRSTVAAQLWSKHRFVVASTAITAYAVHKQC